MISIGSKIIEDNGWARWTALVVVSFATIAAYFITDVMSPLEVLLTTPIDKGGLGWTADTYGFFSGSYGFLNVFLFMLFIAGLILDKFGNRFTGVLSCCLMLSGTLIKYYGISHNFGGESLSLGFIGYERIPYSAFYASIGFSIFGIGCEMCNITVTKIVSKWFSDHELALALAIQVALSRFGTAAALLFSLPIAMHFHDISAPLIFSLGLLVIAFLGFFIFCVMDKKRDSLVENSAFDDPLEVPRASTDVHFWRELRGLFNNPGYCVSILICLFFYSGIFPFMKFATKIMIVNYGVEEEWAGIIPSILPFGTIVLTPLFGSMYDKYKQGMYMMFAGCVLACFVYVCFALHLLPYSWFALTLTFLLMVSLALVPSALWPTIPRIVPMNILGTSYSIIFYIQNIGLMIVPMIVGIINDNDPSYMASLILFAMLEACAAVCTLMLSVTDKIMDYGLKQD